MKFIFFNFSVMKFIPVLPIFIYGFNSFCNFFVKRIYSFSKILVFHLLRDFCNVRNHLVPFLLFRSLEIFIYMKKNYKKNYKFFFIKTGFKSVNLKF